jgi:tagatose-1,6-bisphosphate aldolase non-catalytic subunit AgaZ/GatZ
MGAANVGPEFTAAELEALRGLCRIEAKAGREASGFEAALEAAVIESGRWRKWLQADEVGQEFDRLQPDRRAWLVSTGARYVWTGAGVVEARRRLYANLKNDVPGPHAVVVDRIAAGIQRYVDAFGLRGSIEPLGLSEG